MLSHIDTYFLLLIYFAWFLHAANVKNSSVRCHFGEIQEYRYYSQRVCSVDRFSEPCECLMLLIISFPQILCTRQFEKSKAVNATNKGGVHWTFARLRKPADMAKRVTTTRKTLLNGILGEL